MISKSTADSIRNFIHEWSLNILILLFGTTTLVQAFIVPTASMESTVMTGDHMLVDKLSYAPEGPISKWLLPYREPQRGDIIVFRYPVDINQNYVKRVIGVPGDHIHLVNKQVWVNGKQLQEPFTQHIDPQVQAYRDNFPNDFPTRQSFAPFTGGGEMWDRAHQMLTDHVKDGELVVPEGYYFAMGDNRDNSADSRYWGLVPRQNIIGKPSIIFWSYQADTSDLVGYSETHFVDLAKNFFVKTRWERTFKLIRGYPLK